MLYEKLLYWKYENGIRLSKTKFFSILIFMDILISRIYYTHDLLVAFEYATITALVSFAIGYKIHNSIKNDSIGSYGLKKDIKHLFLYWNNSNEFVLSKTKIATIAIYLISLIYFNAINGLNDVFVNSSVSLFFALPVFFIGYFIHTNEKNEIENEPIKAPVKSKTKKIERRNKANIPEFNKYSTQLIFLKNEFYTKEKKVRQLVETTFQPPQLTYDKFILYLDKCKTNFKSQTDVIETIIDLASKYTEELENEIEERINILKTIIDKIDLLNNELALNIGKSKSDDGEIENLFEEMETLIDSVKNYD